jgi:hypothetical protein
VLAACDRLDCQVEDEMLGVLVEVELPPMGGIMRCTPQHEHGSKLQFEEIAERWSRPA